MRNTCLIRAGLRCLALAAIATAVAPVPAGAQIYMSRDAKGTVVLSNRPVDAPTPIYEVSGAPSYRTTKESAAGNAERFEALVREHAERQSLRPELVRAVIQVESGFNPGATSPKGAMGLMQLMPQTARELGVANAYDPDENIRGGTTYLRQLLNKYGQEDLALAAYNAGPGAVDKYNRTIPPYRETQNYVARVGSKATPAKPVKKPLVLYKTIEIINDRVVPKFSQTPPNSGPYEVHTF